MKRYKGILALLLLLVYASSATAIVPATFALLAALEGGHSVMVCPTEGGTQIRLHHREGDFTPEVCDHAGLLARVVVRFCRPATEGDHSLSTRQVAGGLASQDDETERSIKDKSCWSLPEVGFAGRYARIPQASLAKAALSAGPAAGGEMLRRMATIRLLI